MAYWIYRRNSAFGGKTLCCCGPNLVRCAKCWVMKVYQCICFLKKWQSRSDAWSRLILFVNTARSGHSEYSCFGIVYQSRSNEKEIKERYFPNDCCWCWFYDLCMLLDDVDSKVICILKNSATSIKILPEVLSGRATIKHYILKWANLLNCCNRIWNVCQYFFLLELMREQCLIGNLKNQLMVVGKY